VVNSALSSISMEFSEYTGMNWNGTKMTGSDMHWDEWFCSCVYEHPLINRRGPIG